MPHFCEHRRFSGSDMVYVLGFLLLIGLASLHSWGGQASAQGSDADVIMPGGTVPGTVPPPLRARVTFVHAAPFTTPIEATAIDICDQADQVVDDLTGIVFQQSELLTLDPGTYNWSVASTGSNCEGVVLVLPTLRLENASHTLVVITGDGVNYPIDTIVTILDAGGTTLYFPIMARQE
jgi:hypothetical protein